MGSNTARSHWFIMESTNPDFSEITHSRICRLIYTEKVSVFRAYEGMVLTPFLYAREMIKWHI